jgi:hypothetical protein
LNYHTALESQLKTLVANARDEVVIVAPFIKKNELQRVLVGISEEVNLTIFTRWRINEIVLGVSDIGIWDVVLGRSNSSAFIMNDLHAKFFRSDRTCLIGSANISAAALGVASRSNLELLIPMSFDEKLFEFEVDLRNYSTEITQATYDEMVSIIAEFREISLDEDIASSEKESLCWLPAVRNPEDLWSIYNSSDSLIPKLVQSSGYRDLLDLGIPNGLQNEWLFNRAIAVAMKQTVVVREIDKFVEEPRRFGEVKELIKTISGLDNDESKFAWQTTMRWLLYFFPDDYRRTRPKHSEIFQRKMN